MGMRSERGNQEIVFFEVLQTINIDTENLIFKAEERNESTS